MIDDAFPWLFIWALVATFVVVILLCIALPTNEERFLSCIEKEEIKREECAILHLQSIASKKQNYNYKYYNYKGV